MSGGEHLASDDGIIPEFSGNQPWCARLLILGERVFLVRVVRAVLSVGLFLFAVPINAQRMVVRAAPPVEIPGQVDGNSPSFCDSFWGPAIHWNTHLESYVVLMNHACCAPGWPQDGIHASFNADLSDPRGWSRPEEILWHIGFGPGFYPQVMGMGAGETDTVAGQKARLFIQGRSRWEVVFGRTDEMPDGEEEAPPQFEAIPRDELSASPAAQSTDTRAPYHRRRRPHTRK